MATIQDWQRIVTDAGFKAPDPVYRREDPRGAEYGHFTIHAVDSEWVEVTKHDDDGDPVYTFRCGPHSFRRWVGETFSDYADPAAVVRAIEVMQRAEGILQNVADGGTTERALVAGMCAQDLRASLSALRK